MIYLLCVNCIYSALWPAVHAATSPTAKPEPFQLYRQILAMLSYLEDVAKAISKACSIPLMKAKGFFLVMSIKSRGKRKSPWMTSPDTTVMAYSPSFCPITEGSSISRIFPAMRNTMPKGKYLQRISMSTYLWGSNNY